MVIIGRSPDDNHGHSPFVGLCSDAAKGDINLCFTCVSHDMIEPATLLVVSLVNASSRPRMEVRRSRQCAKRGI